MFLLVLLLNFIIPLKIYCTTTATTTTSPCYPYHQHRYRPPKKRLQLYLLRNIEEQNPTMEEAARASSCCHPVIVVPGNHNLLLRLVSPASPRGRMQHRLCQRIIRSLLPNGNCHHHHHHRPNSNRKRKRTSQHHIVMKVDPKVAKSIVVPVVIL